MRKLISLSLALVLCMTLLTVSALADVLPQPEGGKKFEGTWAIAGCIVQIDYEEEGYRVRVVADNFEDSTGTEWEYSCYYHADTDSLVSVSSSKTTYTIDPLDPDNRKYNAPVYEGLDEEKTCTTFSLDEHGYLNWLDRHENDGTDLEFHNIGPFAGIWKSVESAGETVEAEIMWNGSDQDEWFYTVYVNTGDPAGDTFTMLLANCFYNEETGKLEGSGSVSYYTRNASGEYDVRDDGDSVDIVFSVDSDGHLLLEGPVTVHLEPTDVTELVNG